MTAAPAPGTARTPTGAEPVPLRMTTLDGEILQAECLPGRSVLDAAADAGYLLPSLCRKGTCGACAVTVTDGPYALGPHSPEALSPERARAGGALLCRTYAEGPLAVSLPYERSRIISGRLTERTATVSALERLTGDLVRLVLQLDEDGQLGSGAEFEPGQFAQLRIPGETEESRAYSYANAPNWDGELEFYVRLRPGGHFSTWLDTRATPGDSVTVLGPQGAFGLVETGLRPRWFVAGGTGTAPLLSMARRMAEFGESHPLRFYSGADTVAQLCGAEAISALRDELPQLETVFSVKEPVDRAGYRHGRMIDALVADLVRLRTSGGTDPDLYICGSPGLIDAVERAAADHGLAPDRVLSEKFNSSAT
ncbi:2Fe-2S iron-sulfur cluster-binding protein [Streptomyces celluloflavus]|uniref:2Fe-2S iron-sulfur cluster-binding protein n=1 Tax=Streptomyces celluloflavus TaxID=58344 RepID=UPI00366715DD